MGSSAAVAAAMAKIKEGKAQEAKEQPAKVTSTEPDAEAGKPASASGSGDASKDGFTLLSDAEYKELAAILWDFDNRANNIYVVPKEEQIPFPFTQCMPLSNPAVLEAVLKEFKGSPEKTNQESGDRPI